MKITSLILVSILLFCINPSFSQTTKDILDKANENKERKENSGSSSRSRSSNSSSDGGEKVTAEGIELFFEAIYYTFDGLIKLQGLVLNQKQEKDIKRITSLELRSQYGGLPTSYQISSSTVQGSWGLFSASARYYHQFENRVGNYALYNTLDLQWLQLNVLPFENFNLRLGMGTMNEQATSLTYPEKTLAIDIYPSKRLRLSTEGRFVTDPDTETQVRQEWNVGAYYQLGKNYNPINFHAHLNAMHALYYETVDVWMISGGLSMRVE